MRYNGNKIKKGKNAPVGTGTFDLFWNFKDIEFNKTYGIELK